MAEPVWSIDPRTGQRRERVAVEATDTEVDAAVRAAERTRGALADRAVRVALLRTAAELLDAAQPRIVATADAETALGDIRLTGELARTTAQLRAFADEVLDGGYLGVVIDHADDRLTPPRPDLRRYQIPLGVVAVYAASNFPLAFSVSGGDTASALAAGCPVVVKAHPGHPATSQLSAQLLRQAAARVGLPEDVVAVVHGFDAGVALVRHPLVAAAGFTGSVRGGRALFDAAAARPVPIPFHGELGSLNPVVVSQAAAVERAERIGTELSGSMTLGVGQFCTKPGLVLAPTGEAGDRLLAALARGLSTTAPGVLLNARTREAYLAGVVARTRLPEVTMSLAGTGQRRPADGSGESGGHTVEAGFLTVPAARLAVPGPYEELLEECFGPLTVVARYRDEEEVGAVLRRLPGNLTATAHLSTAECRGEGGRGARLLAALVPVAGRVLVNGWPTGVAVTHAQHHGGPYPATTSTTTSVGTAAIGRWLRPVAYQSTPPALLPAELREDNPLGLPRRVDGRRD